MSAGRDRPADRVVLDVAANEPRMRSAMSALGLDESGESPRIVKAHMPDPPVEFDNGTPMIRFRRCGARWLIEPEGYLPRSDFARLIRCLKAEGAFFGRHGTPHKSWSVAIEYGAQFSRAFINSGFSTSIAAASQAAPSPNPSGAALPSSSSSADGPDGVVSGAAAGGRR